MTKLHLERTPPAPVNGERTQSGQETDTPQKTSEQWAEDALRTLRLADRDWLMANTAEDEARRHSLEALAKVGYKKAVECFVYANGNLPEAAKPSDWEWFEYNARLLEGA